MNRIEINTSQNVKIEYAIAGTHLRGIALFLDIMVIFFSYMLLSYIFSFAFMNSKAALYILFLVLTPFVAFYSLWSEFLFNGQTLGKKITGIQVIRLDGEEPTFFDSFNRWAMRILDIWFSVFILGFLLITGNKKGQRLGDIIAGTTVILKNQDTEYRLEDILKLNQIDKINYEFTFGSLERLSESDVLLIKNLVLRFRRHRNAGHRKAVNEMIEKLRTVITFDSEPRNTDESKIKFLNQLISQFVIFTR